MLNPIFESILNDERYERYDGINEVLILSTVEYELKVTKEYIKLDKVQYNMNLADPYHGIPLHRETVVVIWYKQFLAGTENETFGVTKDDVNAVLSYYRSLG